MGVINVSPESFYRDSVWEDAAALTEAAVRLESEGADFIDIGAMSTAPYLATVVPPEEELRRMTWAIEKLAGVVRVPLSADTQRADVAAAALGCGARILNDVAGLRGDPGMAAVARAAEGVVLMASEIGLPAFPSTAAPHEVARAALEHSLALADTAGISRQRIVLDPGIGFFTHLRQPAVEFNCGVLRALRELEPLGQPLLVGVSRKSFIGKLTGRIDPAERLAGSLAASAVAVYNGACIVRTHDVGATRDAVRVAEALRQNPFTPLARS